MLISRGFLPKSVSVNVEPSLGILSSFVSLRTTFGSLGLINPGEPAVVMNTATAVESRASVNPILVPSFISLSNQTSGDNSLFGVMTQFVTVEIKVRKTNKEKLKAVLAVIDSMDEDELGEVGSVPRLVHLPSLQENIGFVIDNPSPSSASILVSLFKFFENPFMKNTLICLSTSETDYSLDVLDLANFVLTWDFNDDFCNFCSKIGISFNSRVEVGNFLNLVCSQQSLPLVNLDDFSDCIELF